MWCFYLGIYLEIKLPMLTYPSFLRQFRQRDRHEVLITSRSSCCILLRSLMLLWSSELLALQSISSRDCILHIVIHFKAPDKSTNTCDIRIHTISSLAFLTRESSACKVSNVFVFSFSFSSWSFIHSSDSAKEAFSSIFKACKICRQIYISWERLSLTRPNKRTYYIQIHNIYIQAQCIGSTLSHDNLSR